MVLDLSREIKWPQFPTGWAFIALRSEDGVLWCGFSARPRQRFERMKQEAENDPQTDDLMRRSREYVVLPCADAMDALLTCKIHIHDHHPPFQHSIRPYGNYVYLGLDAWRFPFISIQEHTNDDWTYAGPFRDRFFLADVLDSVARILKLPSCSLGVWPCERLDNGLCRGWCLNLDETRDPDPAVNPEKLDALLKESFLLPGNSLVEIITRQRDSYFEDLEFEKAALLDDEIARLEKYRDWMRFLAVSKSLDADGDGFTVRGGLVATCTRNGKVYHFPPDGTDYRASEALALNLANVDEAKVVYDHLMTLHKE